MGLNVSHDCWDGSYSRFDRFRNAIAVAAGLGKLSTFVGFGGQRRFPDAASEPLVVLLDHSDDDGEIAASDCAPLAARLDEIAPLLDEDDFAQRAHAFAAGLRGAAAANEPVEFC